MLEIQTAVVNNPTFLELQYETLKFFTQGDFTFTVFNDAKPFPDFSNFGDPTVHRTIQKTCERLNIPCIPVANEHHKHNSCPAMRCADAMNAMLDYQRSHRGQYLCLDSDMFPIAPFSTDRYSAYSAAIVPQTRSNNAGKTVPYFWNGVYAFDMSQIPAGLAERMNWRCNDVEGVWTDVGGGMYYFLKDAKETNMPLYEIPHKWSGQWSFDEFPAHLDARWLAFLMTDSRNQGGKFFSELYDDVFFHYRAGGNWEKRNPEAYRISVEALKQTVYSVCRG